MITLRGQQVDTFIENPQTAGHLDTIGTGR
jgi:hypothetical protein